jgi:chorismate dehydratase
VGDPIRIGAVSYLNTRPLVHGLVRSAAEHRIELSFGVPAELADRLAEGRLDVALLSVVELGRLDGLELVPGLGITTRGRSGSVLLVSRRPPAELRTVALDPESRTSNALAQVLLDALWKVRPRCEVGPLELERALSEYDAAVRIGDKALFEPLPPGANAHDLAELWTEHTRLPFVFAAWAARPGVVDSELYRLLHASRREGTRSIDAIAAGFVWKGSPRQAEARAYLREHIHYRLGSDEIRAIELFLSAAASIGVIGRAGRVALALPRQSRCHDLAAAATGKSE